MLLLLMAWWTSGMVHKALEVQLHVTSSADYFWLCTRTLNMKLQVLNFVYYGIRGIIMLCTIVTLIFIVYVM